MITVEELQRLMIHRLATPIIHDLYRALGCDYVGGRFTPRPSAIRSYHVSHVVHFDPVEEERGKMGMRPIEEIIAESFEDEE